MRLLRAYLQYLGVGSACWPVGHRIHGAQDLIIKVYNDIAYGFTLFPHVFPALIRLDIELDTVDCLTGDHFCDILGEASYPLSKDSLWRDRTNMIAELIRIGHLRNAGMIEVHVCWKDFGFRKRMLNNCVLSEDLLMRLKDDFMERLMKLMPVRDVVSDT